MALDVKTAQEMLEEAKTYWSDNYDLAKEDLEFSVGIGHWDEKDKKRRDRKGRPSLVVNQLPQFIHQVTNDMRQNTPSINVLPVGEGSDIETAKIFKGLIKNIEYKSGADEVYDTAGEYAVKCGIGFIRIDHDYKSAEGLQQELFLKRVQNPLSVYLDPSSIECDGRDAEWAIVLDTMTRKVFEKTYPGKDFVSFDDNGDKDSITIAEVFIKEYSDQVMKADPEGKMIPVEEGEDTEGVKTRKQRKVKIARYKFSGSETLESTRFPGKYIPIVPVYGEEVWVNGKRMIMSLIRQSKDAQRRYNYLTSKEAEILAMMPISPFIAQAGTVENHADGWNNPGDASVLLYDGVDAKGNPAQKPERLAPPPVPTGIVNSLLSASEDIKKTMGLYNASIGQRSNETSGVAIDARKVEGEVATFHYGDNRNRSITQCGRILVCAIPEIYDTPMALDIIGEEEDAQVVGVNGAKLQPGQEQEHDLTEGEYDVRVSTGASYTTKRQEAAQFMSDMVKANPALMQVAGDLLVKNMDIAGADALAARLRKMVPKELTAEEDAKKDGQQAPNAEVMQLQQVLQQMQAQMQQMAAELQSKQADEQVKMAEVQIKAKEVAIKEGELKLKYLQTAKEAPDQGSSVQKVEASPDDSIEVLQARIQEKINGQNQAALEQQNQAQMEADREAREEHLKMMAIQQAEQDSAMRRQESQALMASLNGIQQMVGGLIQEIQRPKTVIRDANGMVAGVK